MEGYWPAWRAEDGGPQRQAQHGAAGPALGEADRLEVVHRSVVASTMVVHPDGRLATKDLDLDTLEVCWRRAQDHASHMVRYPGTGELVTFDHDPDRMAEDLVVLDIATGHELARAATGSPVQGGLFGVPGFGRDLYAVTFAGVSRVAVAS